MTLHKSAKIVVQGETKRNRPEWNKEPEDVVKSVHKFLSENFTHMLVLYMEYVVVEVTTRLLIA